MELKELGRRIEKCFDELSDEEEIELWNKFCDNHGYNDDRGIDVYELDEIFPLETFEDAAGVVNMFSSVMYDTGIYNCSFAKIGGNGYLVPFDLDEDIDRESLIEDIINGYIDDIPNEMQNAIDEFDEEEDEEE